MKVIAYLLGVLCIIVAIVYFVLPADQLPTFMPGYDAAVSHTHMKHGVVAAVVGVVLLVLGWIAGRRD